MSGFVSLRHRDSDQCAPLEGVMVNNQRVTDSPVNATVFVVRHGVVSSKESVPPPCKPDPNASAQSFKTTRDVSVELQHIESNSALNEPAPCPAGIDSQTPSVDILRGSSQVKSDCGSQNLETGMPESTVPGPVCQSDASSRGQIAEALTLSNNACSGLRELHERCSGATLNGGACVVESPGDEADTLDDWLDGCACLEDLASQWDLSCPSAMADLEALAAVWVAEALLPKLHCDICLETLPITYFRQSAACGHRFCAECLSTYVTRCISVDKYPVPCPKCKVPISKRNLARLCDDEHKDAIGRLHSDWLVYTLQTHYACRTPGCHGAIEIDPDVWDHDAPAKQRCPRCNFHMCSWCRRVWHDGQSCEQAEQTRVHDYIAQQHTIVHDAAAAAARCAVVDTVAGSVAACGSSSSNAMDEQTRLLLQLARRLNFGQCPGCHMLIEKADGCDHITCRCGADFTIDRRSIRRGTYYTITVDSPLQHGCADNGTEPTACAVTDIQLPVGDSSFEIECADGCDVTRAASVINEIIDAATLRAQLAGEACASLPSLCSDASDDSDESDDGDSDDEDEVDDNNSDELVGLACLRNMGDCDR